MHEVAEPIFESITTMETAEFEQWALEREGWDPHHYELLHGRIVAVPPAAWPHGEIELRVGRRLAEAIEGTGAHAFGSSQGFVLPSGDVVEPDGSIVSAARWRSITPEAGRFLRVVPDLVVEVLSSSTSHRDRGEKKAIYERNGVREYWIVDPRTRTVTIHLGDGARFDEGRLVHEHERATSAVVPGLTVLVASLF